MLRHILLNSTAPAAAADYDLVATMVARSTAHSPSSLNTSLLRPTAAAATAAASAAAAGGRGGGRDGELHKPDLVTYVIMCLLLFLLVLLIVFFINCQLRNSFFASMPYDRSLREARTSYK